MWTEPKVNWVSTDCINYSDYNRIKNNVSYIKDLALMLYLPFQFENMGDDKSSYADFPYADEFNSIENNIENILNGTYPFCNFEKKQWFENMRTPDYQDLNRIESACLDLYNGLNAQLEIKRSLAFTLGRYRTVKI